MLVSAKKACSTYLIDSIEIFHSLEEDVYFDDMVEIGTSSLKNNRKVFDALFLN